MKSSKLKCGHHVYSDSIAIGKETFSRWKSKEEERNRERARQVMKERDRKKRCRQEKGRK